MMFGLRVCGFCQCMAGLNITSLDNDRDVKENNMLYFKKRHVNPALFHIVMPPHHELLSEVKSKESGDHADADADSNGDPKALHQTWMDAARFPYKANFSCKELLQLRGHQQQQHRQLPIANDVLLTKSIILTGPNSSGKTTMMKTMFINLLLIQQVGFGFFDAALQTQPYHKMHCYMNIIDTADGGSLFEKEAIRCKHVVNALELGGPTVRHLCIMDELFSGTNMQESVSFSTSLMNYFACHDNMTVILTTHSTDVCESIDEAHITNCLMETTETEHENVMDRSLVNHYKMSEGISYVRGGIYILRKLRFPESVMNMGGMV